MVEIALEESVVRENHLEINAFLHSIGYLSLESPQHKHPRGTQDLPDKKNVWHPCYLYNIPNFYEDKIKELIKKLLKTGTYQAEPLIFMKTSNEGEWKIVEEDKKPDLPTQQIIVHGDVGHFAGHDQINFIQPITYLNLLEKAVEDSTTIPIEEKKSIISPIKSLKDSPWVVSIGGTAIFELGKKLLGLP